MYWFRFEIPRNEDGSIATYSPGWHGVMPRCPNGVVVDLYNDKEGYGIAHTLDKFIPKEVQVIPDKDALALVQKGQDIVDSAKVMASDSWIAQDAEPLISEAEQIYVGDKLLHRWDVLPEVQSVEPTGQTEISTALNMIPGEAWFWCNECGKVYLVKYSLPSGLNAANINLAVTCPEGHKGTLSIKSSVVKEEVTNG